MSAEGSRSALAEVDKKGAFIRKDSTFRDIIKEGGKFPPEAGRYHLYISLACPWAHRCYIVRSMKGLEDVIGLSIVHPTWQYTKKEVDDHCGWVFRDPESEPLSNTNGFGSFDARECIPDSINGTSSMRELYNSIGYEGKYSVPVLWDKKEKTIVNNESSEIVCMFNSAFNAFAKNPDLNLDPIGTQEAQEEVNSWIYPTINNGVYRCGFAKSQEAYDEAVSELDASLDKLEELLSKQRYVTGDKLTISDIRLFVTLVRFDEVYVVYFKTNTKALREYPNILNYMRELYQIPEIQKTVSMYHIKTHYFTSHPTLNHYAIVPKGSNTLEILSMPHNRTSM